MCSCGSAAQVRDQLLPVRQTLGVLGGAIWVWESRMDQINFTVSLKVNPDGWDAEALVTLGDVQAHIPMSYLTVERYAAYFTDMKARLAVLRKSHAKS